MRMRPAAEAEAVTACPVDVHLERVPGPPQSRQYFSDPSFRTLRECRIMALLASLLHVLPHKFLTVLLEHLVDLVQERVDVLGHLLVALGDLRVDRGLDLVGLLARAGGPLLPAGVSRRHGCLQVRARGGSPSCCPESYSPTPTERVIRSGRGRRSRQPPVIVSTSSCAVAEASNSAPTCSRVPRSGSIVGMRTRFSRPRSKTTESHEAAATCAG